ncbi:MAG: hypothetical protein ACM3ZB_06370 [bacterium]
MHLSPQQLLACIDGEAYGIRGKRALRHFQRCDECRAEAERIAGDLRTFQEQSATADFATPEALEKGLAGLLDSMRERNRALPAVRQLEIYFGSRAASAPGADAARLNRLAGYLSSVFLGRKPEGDRAARRIRIPMPWLIVLVTLVVLLGCVMVTMVAFATGRYEWIDAAFRYPGALLLILLAAAELHLTLAVRRRFSRGDLMRHAWTLLVAAAFCHLAGEVLTQVFSSVATLPQALGGAAVHAELSRIGLLAGGPVRHALLAAGLGFVVRACSRSGLLARLSTGDRIAVAAVGVFALIQAHDAWRDGSMRLSIYSVAGLATDPLIAILLAQALLIRRALSEMGWGLVARCWAAFAAGAVLTSAGNLGLWAGWHGYAPWPWSAGSWFIWLLASASFALGPAYQARAENLVARTSVLPRDGMISLDAARA